MGPKLINCCMPEPMGTKEFGENAEGDVVKESKACMKKTSGAFG